MQVANLFDPRFPRLWGGYGKHEASGQIVAGAQ